MRHSSEDLAAKILGQSGEGIELLAKGLFVRSDLPLATDTQSSICWEEQMDSLLEKRAVGVLIVESVDLPNVQIVLR